MAFYSIVHLDKNQLATLLVASYREFPFSHSNARDI